MKQEPRYDYDVVIIGAGLAGLSLARQLLLSSDTVTILHLEKRLSIPQAGQKVGEATVQVSGYYFAKVLELEEYLLREHYLKYNLRFYWKTPGMDNSRFESYSQSFIRGLSNVPTYQLNRNEIERELLRRNQLDPRYRIDLHALNLDIALEPNGQPHRVVYTVDGVPRTVTARWVVDAAGRAHVLQKKQGLERKNPIRHGASFFWVEGLVDIEFLTDSTHKQIRLNPARRYTGHMPFWLATNHFCEEGLWFWTIPLQGVTSLGLVYDNRLIKPEDVNDPNRLLEWVCEHFPLFARDLPKRKILHWACYRDFSFDCAQTIDRNRWALIGEAGRWSDPLYSPGGDVISIYCTLLTDAILTTDQADLDQKAVLFEELERAVYGAYVPGFAVSYDCLGDQEAYALKYIWELGVYFGFYVFPMINDLFTDTQFIGRFLQRFSRIERLNSSLQSFLSGFFQWKKVHKDIPRQPMFVDFYETGALIAPGETFYEVGVTVDEATAVLDRQLQNALQVARQTVAHVYASTLGDPSTFWNKSFLESLDVERLSFDPDEMQRHYAHHAGCTETYQWPRGWKPDALMRLSLPRRAAAAVSV
jgi:2-polyprenyl-6-methoxyphenol hydroxylase-like FAD-dependent oxidoreductase